MNQVGDDLRTAIEVFFYRPDNTISHISTTSRRWEEMSCEECDRVVVEGRRPSGPDEQCAALHLINCPTHRKRWDRLAKEFRRGRNLSQG